LSFIIQYDEIFKLIDIDGKGEISTANLLALVPVDMSKMVEGLQKDGKVNLAEFKEAITKNDVSKEALEIVSAKLRIAGCKAILPAPQVQLAQVLADNGQTHLFKPWNEESAKAGKPKMLMASLSGCDSKYPGGLKEYVKKAKVLLASSKAGTNPFAGYTPEVPVGMNLNFGDDKFLDYEGKGIKELKGAAFVLVAGGLGERLGYGGIKVALPLEITTMTCYLQFYCQNILALQALANTEGDGKVQLPFAIMTSGDTHAKTEALLKENKNFGMAQGQITLVQQDKVPAIMNNDGAFATDSSDPFKLLTKPHGHGDVHLLLYQAGLVKKWADSGVEWISFFQDTNGLVFNALTACMGVSKELGLEVNSLTVPRKPGEAVGAICKLVPNEEGKKKSLSELTINVEYNQLDALLKTTPVGGDQADEKSGLSPYPGNINVLVFAAKPYAKNLEKTHGVVPEFVNPKYKDAEKTTFKKPTRLECMMQDYPRLCDEGAKVGFTSLDRFSCFSAVKNNINDAKTKAEKTGFGESGCTGEADAYKINRKKLKLLGIEIDDDGKVEKVLGIPCSMGAKVCLAPSFAATLAQLKTRFPEPKAVKISSKSTLVLEGDITVKKLELDGALTVIAKPGTKVVIDEGKVENDGHEFKMIDVNDKSIDEKFRIRGYILDKKAGANFEVAEKGSYTISQGKAEKQQ